ncbi:MAG: hypothetical protein C4320_10105 [Armatimonadota bacterium]
MIPAPTDFGARPRTNIEHARLAAFWFVNNFHWGALILILIPGDIARMVPDNRVARVGELTAFGAIFALVVPLWAAVLSDRSMNRIGRRRPFIAGGTLINILGLGMMAVSATMGSFIGYAAGFIVVQFGNNFALGPYMGVMPDLVVPEQRGIASGYMALMSQVGTLLGAAGVGVLLGGQPPIARYALVSVLLVLGVAIGWGAIDERPRAHRPEPMDWTRYIKSLWIDPRVHPDFFWVWVTRFLVMLGFYAILPFINYYLRDVIGVPADSVEKNATALLGVILVISSISGMLGGAISDKIGRKKVVFVANGMIAVVSLGFIFAHSFWSALTVGAAFGLGYGAYISVDYALGNDVLPDKEAAGKDMAVWHVAMTLPQVLAAPIAGILITVGGKTLDPIQKVDGEPLYHYALSGYASVFILCSICFALGAILLQKVRGVR